MFSICWAAAEAVCWREHFSRKVNPERGSSYWADVKEWEDSILQSYDINSRHETSTRELGDECSPCGISGAHFPDIPRSSPPSRFQIVSVPVLCVSWRMNIVSGLIKRCNVMLAVWFMVFSLLQFEECFILVWLSLYEQYNFMFKVYEYQV